MARAYDMATRAAAAARTAERITQAAEALLTTHPVNEVTLQAIAEDAGVTVQTVLRHMGSRDGCFDAVRAAVIARVDAERGHTPPGDVQAALDDLLGHYEAEGRLVLHLLAQETSDPLAQQAAADGRAYHRAWVERCFGPLTDVTDPTRVDALVAATDLYVWKLLRLDLQRSPEATRATLEHLVRSLVEAP